MGMQNLDFRTCLFREGDLEEEKEDGKPNQIGIVVEQVTNIKNKATKIAKRKMLAGWRYEAGLCVPTK